MSAASRGSSVKRTATAKDPTLNEHVKRAVKRARTERRLPKEAEQSLPHEHGYQTRSKTKSSSSTRNKKAEKNTSQGVPMKDINHCCRLRSQSKTERPFSPRGA